MFAVLVALIAGMLHADDRSAGDPGTVLARAVRLAEAAVDADDRDATAHLALFCALGKQLGTSCGGFTTLRRLPRLRAEIDRAVELAPAYPSALVAKAGFLIELPRVLGGDPAAAEALLRRALALEPDNLEAQLYLGRVLAARGDVEDARRQIGGALARAEEAARPRLAKDARMLLAQLDD